jgi:hypothetical protein
MTTVYLILAFFICAGIGIALSIRMKKALTDEITALRVQNSTLFTIRKRLEDELAPLRARFAKVHDIEAETQRVRVELVTAQVALEKFEQEAADRRIKLDKEHQDRLAATLLAFEKVEQEATEERKRLHQAYQEAYEAKCAAFSKFEQEDTEKRNLLDQTYQAALVTYNTLKAEVASLEENLEDISYGLYNPHFTFQTSEEYKAALETLRSKQRDSIRQDRAACCLAGWTVSDSKVKGARLVKLYKKMLLRAFNGECDATVANVTWNNIEKMEERIRKSYAAINECGKINKDMPKSHVFISDEYLQLKLDEVRLTHEYEEKRWMEKEEQRMEREEKREELRAAQEVEEAQEKAEQQEQTYEKLLEKARKEAAEATGAQLRDLTEKVASFEAKLDEARKKKEKAISRAQLTKSGFVYVISNIGAFGNDVYKIGMTRRIEPMERVAELSGAAVPFPFDLHAMLYSDNAPELETSLHQFFEDRRLNLVNPRKEFYQNVKLSEIKDFVTKRGLSAQFIDTPEARQWRETVAKRQSVEVVKEPKQEFAPSLFGGN